MVPNSVLFREFPACVLVRQKSSNDFVLRVFFGMCHQLRTEVTDGEEVIRPFNQQSVLVVKHWQAVETHSKSQQ